MDWVNLGVILYVDELEILRFIHNNLSLNEVGGKKGSTSLKVTSTEE